MRNSLKSVDTFPPAFSIISSVTSTYGFDFSSPLMFMAVSRLANGQEMSRDEMSTIPVSSSSLILSLPLKFAEGKIRVPMRKRG